MKKNINKSQVKVEVKSNPEGIITEKYEAVAYFDTDTLFQVSNDRFIVENNIQEFRDRDGQWKPWKDFDDLVLAGIRKIHTGNGPNSRMKVRKERHEITRQEACQWLLNCFIPAEFHADFQIAARTSGMPASVPAAATAVAGNENASSESINPDEIGLIALTTIYEDLICEKDFENAACELNGLQELIKHHPSFRNEALAMQKIFEGQGVLNSLRDRTERTLSA